MAIGFRLRSLLRVPPHPERPAKILALSMRPTTQTAPKRLPRPCPLVLSDQLIAQGSAASAGLLRGMKNRAGSSDGKQRLASAIGTGPLIQRARLFPGRSHCPWPLASQLLWRMTQGRGGLVPFAQRPAAIVVPHVDPMGELLSVLHPQSSYASRFTRRVFITAIARRGTTRTGSVRKARSGIICVQSQE